MRNIGNGLADIFPISLHFVPLTGIMAGRRFLSEFVTAPMCHSDIAAEVVGISFSDVATNLLLGAILRVTKMYPVRAKMEGWSK